MRTILFGCALGLQSVAGAAAAQIPLALTPPGSVVSPRLASAQALTAEELSSSPRIFGAVWAADGRSIVYASNESGRINLWRQAIDGGPARQLSQSNEVQFNPVTTADGKWVIYQSDKGGGEIYDLHALSTVTGKTEQLTATPDVDESRAVMGADSRLIAFSHRLKTGDSANIAVMDLETRTPRILTDETGTGLQWTVAAVARDGSFLVANRSDWSLTVSEVYRISIASGEAQRLTPAGVYARATALSPDARNVALYMGTDAGVHQAALLDLDTKKTTILAPSPWEQSSGRFTPDGRGVLVVSNVDGRDEIKLVDLASRKARLLPLPAGVNSDGLMPLFSPDGNRILFPHMSGSATGDYWTYERKSGKTAKVTALSKLDSAQLPKTSIVHYRSHGGLTISAVLWMPYNLKRDASAPAVVLAHGGPTGQTRDVFDRTASGLASRGYVVLAPNFRGSTGYGKAFLEANLMDLGGGDLQDLVEGAGFLKQTGYVDPRRIGITGGSYGGYLTIMGLAKTPDTWAAGVEMFGIVNWSTMWQHGAPQNRRYQKTLLGDPAEHPEVYERASPLTYLHQVKAPLLILHGANDIRVPKIEAEQVAQVLSKRGSVVEAHYYPDEGHGFFKRENQIDSLRRMLAWFDRYLMQRPAGSGVKP